MGLQQSLALLVAQDEGGGSRLVRQWHWYLRACFALAARGMERRHHQKGHEFIMRHQILSASREARCKLSDVEIWERFLDDVSLSLLWDAMYRVLKVSWFIHRSASIIKLRPFSFSFFPLLKSDF